MTTINNYSVSLTLDANDYISKSALSRSETARLRREIEAARTPAEKYQNSIRLIAKAEREGAIDKATYNRLMAESKAKLDATTKSTKQLIPQIAAMAAGYLSLRKAIEFVVEGVTLAATAEQQQIAFEVMLKDAELAEKFLKNLQSFAAATPFSQQQIIGSAKSLVAFGFSAQEATKQLGILGNISSATGVRIEELAEIIGKMRVQNKIMSEDLNQLAGRGINVFDGLAKQLGVTTDRVKEFASKGKIEFSDLNAVLTDLANNEFGGMMERQAESLAGRWSTFNDELDQTKRLLTEMFVIGSAENLSSGTGLLGQFREGLLNLPTSPGQWADWLLTRDSSKVKGAGSMLRESEAIKAEAEARLDLARRRNRSPRQMGDLSSVDPTAFLRSQAARITGGAGSAGTALMAGFQQLGSWITSNATANAQVVAREVRNPGLAASLEKGSMESANAILKYQNDSQIWQKQSELNAKKTADNTARSATFLEEMVTIFNESGAWGKIR